jgi:hypothetical protein
VVNHERPDLQEQAAALVSQLGQYIITLKELEDSLLARLANAQVRGLAISTHAWHQRSISTRTCCFTTTGLPQGTYQLAWLHCPML